MADNYDYIMKLLVIGDANVGKSSLVLRCVNSKYKDSYLTTIGIDYVKMIKIKRVEIGGKQIKICIWDTAGQERFRAISTSYYRDAHGVIVVYDITNQQSFSNVKIWMDEIAKRANREVSILLLGNKCDLHNEREVFFESGKSYAKDLGISFLETSAKNSDNVDLAIITMAAEIKSRLFENEAKKKMSIVQKNVQLEKMTNPCCSTT